MATSVFVFIVILSILVLIHELGHFIMARRAGVLVEEFGFGLPPRVLARKVGETIYSINLFPFGGFVRLHGENTEEEISIPERAFLNKSKKTRALIVVAGVVMNFILAIVVFSLVYSFNGIPKVVETGEIKVVDIRPGSPAESSGIQKDDIVRLIEGKNIARSQELIDVVDANRGREIALFVERKGQQGLIKITVVPREAPPEGEGALGVGVSSSEVKTYFPPFWQRPFLGIYYGFREAIFWGGLIVGGLFMMIRNLFVGVFPKDVAGPVGLLAITTEFSKMGLFPTLNWLGIVSVNLAILNIIPFPALDGGRLLFIAVEKSLGRRVLPKIESAIHTVGMVLLLILILAITFREVRMISELGFQGYVQFLTQGQSVK